VPSSPEWLFELAYPPLDAMTLFVPLAQTDSNRAWQTIAMGDQLPFRERPVLHRNFIVPLVLADTVPRTYYLRVATESSLQVPLTIYRNQAFTLTNTRFDLFYGALFGTMLTLVALNFVLYFTMRVQSYLLFVLYMAATTWYFASIAGYTQFLVGDMPRLANRLTLASLFIAYSGLALFGRLFLQTFRYAPVLDKVHLATGIFSLVGAIATFFLPYRLMAEIVAAVVLVVSLLCFVTGSVMWRRGNRSAVYFLVALAAFLLGALATLFRNVGLIPATIITVHGVEIGSAIEGVLFSFALAGQYRFLKKQKETAQREALRLQQEVNLRLEEKVRERTQALEESNREIQRQLSILDEQSREIEIANTTLQEKNIQLEDLNREKNEFLGIAAHDLKNPLSSITLSASIVLSYRSKITEEQLQERLETILVTSGRMMEIIKNLLDVNAIETGQFAFTIENINVNEIARQILSEYHDRAAAKSIQLFYENNALQTFVMGDKTALTEVLENLISNALKYSPSDKRVYVQIANTESTNDQSTNAPMPNTLTPNVRISVRDEGPGLSDDDKKKLFGKFARLSARPTGGEDSTGLGLSIVKKMVEAMNGRVWCESELGKGAVFIVELPVSGSLSH
jgi:two-component system, sensor histidine kinase LadS